MENHCHSRGSFNLQLALCKEEMFSQKIFLESFLQHRNSHILRPASTAQANAVPGMDQVFLLTAQCHNFSDLKPEFLAHVFYRAVPLTCNSSCHKSLWTKLQPLLMLSEHTQKVRSISDWGLSLALLIKQHLSFCKLLPSGKCKTNSTVQLDVIPKPSWEGECLPGVEHSCPSMVYTRSGLTWASGKVNCSAPAYSALWTCWPWIFSFRKSALKLT